jgi:hypothetical protein
MARSNEIDMTSGNIFKKMLVYAIPLALSGILQLLYNAADLIVCGMYGSQNATAAISSTNALIQLIINLFLGLATGANILMARCYGSGNKENADYAMTDADSFITDNTTSEITGEDKGFPDWGLTLSAKNVTSTGLTLVVTQSGGNPSGELMTGEPYRLITLVDDTWKVVEELPLPDGVDGRGFNSIGYLIQKGETKEFDINWDWIFGELPKGTYRLIKEFIDIRETANYDPFEYWVEFVIE